MKRILAALGALVLAGSAAGQQIRTAADYDRAVAEAKARVAALEAGTVPASAPSPVQSGLTDQELLKRLEQLERELQQYRRDTAPAPGQAPRAQAQPMPIRPPQVGECRQPIPYEYYQRYYDYRQPLEKGPGNRDQGPGGRQQAPPDDTKRLHVPQPDGTYFCCGPEGQFSFNGQLGGYCGPDGCGPTVCDSGYCPSYCPTGYCPDPYAANYGSFSGGFNGSFGGGYGFAPQPRFRNRLSLNIEFERRRRLLFLLALRRRGIRLNINANFDGGWDGGWGGGWNGGYQGIQPFGAMPYAPTWNGGGQFNAGFNGSFRGGAGGFASGGT